jgi:hypothetical protein
METLHSKEQTKKLIKLKENLSKQLDLIIDLGQKEIQEKPNLKTRSVIDCEQWNEIAQVDKLRAMNYNLLIEFNSNLHHLHLVNEISYLEIQEIKEKK